MHCPYQTLALLNVDLKSLHGLSLNDLLTLHSQPTSGFLHNHVVYNFIISFVCFSLFLIRVH